MAEPTAANPATPPPSFITANADNAIRQSVAGQPNPFLTAQLRQFMARKGRLPVTFFEFANQALDSIPRPPEGMKWVIDSSDGQVKAVPVK